MKLSRAENSAKQEWLAPIELIKNAGHIKPYPIQSLPSIIRNAVTAYHEYGQQPIPLIACSALANVSLACQTLANVARDHLLISSVSLYFLVIASSGERKSAADHVFGQSIRKWEQKMKHQLQQQIKVANTSHNFTVSNRRLTVSLMLQPLVLTSLPISLLSY